MSTTPWDPIDDPVDDPIDDPVDDPDEPGYGWPPLRGESDRLG